MDLYHALNRGVDGRDLFTDSQDYARFVHDLYEFNDSAPAPAYCRRSPNVGLTKSYIREKLVEIHGWVLMKNHYHLLLSEVAEDGIKKFLTKLNIGYAKYFNERHSRHGTLFQGRTKKIPITDHAHFLYVLHYVHLNPLDYLDGATEWRVRDTHTIRDAREALTYLGTYRWSSYLDYCGVKNFPSILSTGPFEDFSNNYLKTIGEYLQESEHPSTTNITLE